MELVTEATTKEAYSGFANGLKNLISSTDGHHRTKASCLICDHLMEWNDDMYLPKIRLKALAGLFSKAELHKHLLEGGRILHKSVYKKLKQYYCYKGEGYEQWMLSMFLSPHGVFVADKGFNCCQACVKILNTSTQPYCVKSPKYTIANGAIIGDAPVKLTRLNDVELALVSIARIDKHIFTFYGDAHKSMHG